MQLAGQVALVTGASRGIGRGCALALAQQGAAVVIGYKEQEAEARAVADLIESLGAKALVWQADVTSAGDCRAMVAGTMDHFGRLDILVNNAGTWIEKLFVDTSLEEWEEQMAVHLRSVYACTHAALPHMMSRRYGRIINMSSIWGISGAAAEVAYSTAKAGQIGFTKALAQEVGPFGITVNALAPGAIDTDMNSTVDAPGVQEWVERTPVRRLGTPAEIGLVVAFLAAPGAGFITGQVLSPNGGILT